MSTDTPRRDSLHSTTSTNAAFFEPAETPRPSMQSDASRSFVDAKQSQATLRSSAAAPSTQIGETTEELRPSIDYERTVPLGFVTEPTAPTLSLGGAPTHEASSTPKVTIPQGVPENRQEEPESEKDAGRVLAAAEKRSRSSSTSGSRPASAPSKGEKGDDSTVEVDPLAGFSNEARATIKAQADVPPTRSIRYIALFRYATIFERFSMIAALVMAAGAGVAQPAMSLIFGNLTTSFTSFGTAQISGTDATAAADALKSRISNNCLYLVAIGVGTFLLTWVYSATWMWTGEAISRRIRQRYLEAVLRQNIAYFDALGGGEVATRLSQDVDLIQEGISDKPAIITHYIKSWRLALVISSIIPAIGLTGGAFQRFIAKGKKAQLDLSGAGGSLVEEVLSSVRTAFSYNLQHRIATIYDERVNIPTEKLGKRMAVLQGVSFAAFFFIIYGAYALAFWWGTQLLLRGQIVPGDIITCFFSILFASFSLVQVSPLMQALGFAKAAGGKIYDTIDRQPPIDVYEESGLQPEKGSFKAEFQIKNLSFVYPSRPNVPILHGFNATFRQGENCALVGGSGSGKSTCTALLLRFYDPIDGTVCLDGIDLRSYNLRWLRSQIGFVGQEPVLFATSIADNVAHGLINTPYENAAADVKLKLVTEACRVANADGFIQLLPQGYDTQIGERGMLLSGGQKQRIAIARAIVSDPPILLLDEATSALDTTSERIVQAALDEASKGRTTITIAHRLSTVAKAEQIIVMSSGRILETGNYTDLVNRPDGAFQRLVNAQRFTEKAAADAVDEMDEKEEVLDEKGEPMTEEDAELAKVVRRATSGVTSLKRGKSGASATAAQEQADRLEENLQPTKLGLTRLFFRIVAINSDQKLAYALGIAGAIACGAVYPVFAIIFGGVLGVFSQSGEPLRAGGNQYALYFFALGIVATAAIASNNAFFFLTSETLGRKLRLQVYRDILRQDVAWFDHEDHASGALTSNVSDYATKIQGLMGTTLGALIQAFFTLLIGIIVAFAYAPRIAAVGLAVIPFTFSAGWIRLRVVVLKDRRSKKAHGKSAQMACEAASAIRTVASLTRERDVLHIYTQMLEAPYRDAVKTALWSNALYGLSTSTSMFGMALLFWFGSNQMIEASLAPSDFFTALMATLFGSIQAGSIFNFVPDLSQASGASRSVITLMDSKPDLVAGVGEKIQSVGGELRFENVHHRYPTRPHVPVLRGLNLTVRAGSFVALVGPSGCGKSTTIGLLERFYSPLAGRILLDGRPIEDLEIESYRSHISLVAQEPTLYDGDLRTNVCFGHPAPETVTDAQVEAACRDANILDFINSLPDGFNTKVGSKGAQLSGGQRQRVAIARALIRNPKILLLDEATSALDSESEKVVQTALDNASKGRTTISIAHRLSSIQKADVIFVLWEGRVAEQGTHFELLAKGGMYSELVKQQALEKEA